MLDGNQWKAILSGWVETSSVLTWHERKKQVRYHLPVLIEQDEDGVSIVSIPTLRGRRTCGRTVSEAVSNIAEPAGLCIQDEKSAPQGVFVGVRDLEIVA